MLDILFLFLSAVKRHANSAGSGCSQKTNPQHHVAAVPGLGAFCLPRRLALLFGLGWIGWLSRVGRSGRVSRIRWLSGFNRLQRGTNLHIFFVLILCAGRIANNFLSRSRITGRYNRIGVAKSGFQRMAPFPPLAVTTAPSEMVKIPF